MNAKLQKQLAYKYKDKKHFKHVIVVPEEAVAELGWKGGQQLELIVKNRQLIIENHGNMEKGSQRSSK